METEHEGAQGLVLWRQPGHDLPGQLMPLCGQSQWPAERRMGECQELLDEDEAAAFTPVVRVQLACSHGPCADISFENEQGCAGQSVSGHRNGTGTR